MTVTKSSLLLVAFARCCLGQTQPPTETLNGIKVDVALKEELNQRFSLNISVSNEASRTLSGKGLFFPPWASPVMILAAFAVDGPDHSHPCSHSRQLRRQLMLDEGRLRVETIPIGSRLEGLVTLNEKFPELVESLRTCDVLVFWSFQIVPLEESVLARFGGWMVIPSKGK